MTTNRRHRRLLTCLAVVVSTFGGTVVCAQSPSPLLQTVFPPGGQVGKTFDVTVTGSSLKDVDRLLCDHPGISFERGSNGKFRARIAANVPTGAYELRAVGPSGLSSPRTFTVGTRPEILEAEPNDTAAGMQPVPLNSVVNGRIAQGGDVDWFRFSAKRGQRVVIECRAERIDSRLRAVLELYDARGRRLAVNRGYFGIDPLISYRIPQEGHYAVKVFDLVYSGSAEHFYRLEIDTGPRVVFAVPPVVQRGKTTDVTLYGWNLQNNTAGLTSSRSHGELDSVQVQITPPKKTDPVVLPIRRRSFQVAVNGFAYRYPGSRSPMLMGITDVPVIRDHSANGTPPTAQLVDVPCEVGGQLVAGDERDWYAINARRGEVFWIEGFGERIASPVDLDVVVLDSTGNKILAHFRDELTSSDRKRFPSAHVDPAGRWVAPADGKYLIMIRSLTGGLEADPRRVYRLSIRREEPDVRLVVVSRIDQPTSLNVPRGGRVIADVLAFRRRGLTGSIRVSAQQLPKGISCPDVWLGPGVNRVPLVISAAGNAPPFAGTLRLRGSCPGLRPRRVLGSSIVRSDLPNGTARLSTGVWLAVSGTQPLRITADGHETRTHLLFGKLKVRHSPGSILDVAVRVERAADDLQAPVKLIGVGLPPGFTNARGTIPAGKIKGHLSFYLPPTLPVGTYTIAVKAQTTVRKETGRGTRNVTVYSNPVTFESKPAAFVVQVDPEAPTQIRRGEIVQIKYTAKRVNGFIGKIHTELMAPQDVIGLRGRGVTFVGQTKSGTIQIIANDDAPLGRQPFLRLYAVGVVEDTPMFHGSCFLNLEIVK